MAKFKSEKCHLCGEPTNGIYYMLDPAKCEEKCGEWTHPVCDCCYGALEPWRKPYRLKDI